MATTKVTSGVLANNAINNSKIAANTITTAQLHSTFTLDGVTEGASELYFTTARANSAIDARVTQSMVNALGINATHLNSAVASVYARTDIAETFSANVSGPTQANTNNSTLLATTAFVNNAIVIDRTVPLNHSSNGRHVNITVTASGGKYYIDGTQQAHVSLQPGFIYRFDQSDSSNVSHLLRFSTTSNGTHSGGSAYTTGVTEVGSAGSAGAYTQIIVEMDTPALYYYCINHNAMGSSVSIGGHSSTDALSEGSTNLYYTNGRADARIALQVGANLDLSSKSTSNLSEGTNLYFNNARAISAVTGSDLDMGGNKVLFGNLYSAEGDLPSASTYHGMFAHVHGTGKGYFAHAGGWKKLLDESSSDTADLTEGTNLYYTVARANTAIDARVTQSMVSSLGFAPLASPTFTGTPAAPTAANTVNTTQLATTAFVTNKITNLIGGAPGTLDTLNELAAAINDDSNYNSTLTTALATKLPKAGGTMTGALIVDAGNAGLDIRLGTDKRVTWSGNIGEIGSTAGFQAVNTAGSALAAFGMRASELKFATGAATRLTIDASGDATFGNNITTGSTVQAHTVKGTSIVRAGNVHVSTSGSVYRTDTAGAGGFHITTNALYPANGTGGIVNGGTSLGASGYRWNGIFSQGVDNSGTISTQDLVVSGNLTVSGTTSQSTTTQSTSSANNMTLLSTVTGSPTANASFEIERGSATNAKILWDETNDKFVIDNTIKTGQLTAGSNTATALAVQSNGTNGGYFNVKSNVGGVATDGNVGLHVGWNKSNGGREVNMIFDGGTTQADTEMIFTSTDGSTYTDIFQINGAVGGGVDVKSGGLKIGGGEVINSSKDLIINNQINFNNATNSSFIGAASTANLRYAADGEHQFDTYNGGWQTRMTIDDNGLDLIGTTSMYIDGSLIIDQNKNITSKDIHIKSGTSGTNTQGLLFTLTDNADAQAFIKKTAYYMHYNANSNEGHRFTFSGTDDLLRMHGSTNSTRPDSIDILAANGLYMNNTQVMTQARALTNVTGNISMFTNNSGYITSADGGNAGLLDGLDSADFIRRGSSYGAVLNTPNGSNRVQFENGSGQSMNSAAGSLSRLECYQATAGADAFMTFHVGGDYAFYFGMDGATNDLSVGGWSMGAVKYRVYHAGNIGSQTMAIGTIEATNRSTFKKGIDLDRDVSNASGISWYSTGHKTWQEYMSSVGVAGCGPNANITSPAGAHGVTSWALRSYIENVTGYGWTWESGSSSQTTGTVMMGLNSGTGNLSVAGTVTANSDKRIKKNIVTIDNALDKVLKLRGVTYQRTDVEDDKVLMGVVAQEVEEIIPEVVTLGDPDDPDSIKSVSYGNMVGVLIEAIKEQQKQIDELKKQIESK